MHPSDRQRRAIALAAFLFTTGGQAVLVLLPAHLVLDLGLAPAAYGALGAVAVDTSVIALAVGRYLAGRTPGRLGLVSGGASVAVVSAVLLLHCTQAAPLMAVLLVGTAALGLCHPAWRALTEVSGAADAAGTARRTGLVLGQLVALVAALLDEVPGGIVAGSCAGLLGVVVLALVVEDRRAPLAPRRSATLARARASLEHAAVRQAAWYGLAAGSCLGCGAVAVAAMPGADPLALTATSGLATAVLVVTGKVLATRSTRAIRDDLAEAARSVVSHALLVGAAAAALVIGLAVQCR
ncbi:hypothetical protein EFL95_09375 [Nocardioides marmorisolisilvae]|uniref:MFS transporter n=1 Tax=Nocardioides marmorisolisilvae TaxID=1542737 RepID=A0A3N0DUC4_9ACTN|nr:hypothetical protein [Nocardioides marmorisolisilvae]RNL79222.1 hypothetical protein EFL95_09375 [Nocardioides marmorisolisilvae]